MVKFTIAFRAPPGMGRQACQDYYRNSHGRLIQSVPEFLRHVRSYTQNFVMDQFNHDGGEPVMDGVSELWFDNWDAYKQAFAEPRYQELIRPDEERFADLSSVLVMFSDEYEIYAEEKIPHLKYFRLLFKNDQMDTSQFEYIWNKKYASAVKSSRNIRDCSVAYIQNRLSENDNNPFLMSSSLSGIDEYRIENENSLPSFLEEENKIFHSSEMLSTLDKQATIEVVCRTQDVSIPQKG